MLFAPNDYVEAFLQTTLFHAFTLRDQGEDDVDPTDLFVEEAYLTLREPNLGLALQVGRQSFEDPRQWLYDAELDAVRARYRAQRLSLELAASREALLDSDLLDPDEVEWANNYVLYAAYELSGDVSMGAYGIVRDGAARDQPIFLGLQSAGTIGGRLSYWLDAAHVRGREDGSDLRGYGVDLLGAYHFDAPLSPHLILGYAFGSGDSDPDDDRDGAFRQTGLQGNEIEVGGHTPFRYYGEAFDPELSNLSIFTAGFGARPTAELSADLVYHYYLQDHAADEVRDSRSTPSRAGGARGSAARSTSCSGSRRRRGTFGSGVFSVTSCPDARLPTARTLRSSLASRPSTSSEPAPEGDKGHDLASCRKAHARRS